MVTVQIYSECTTPRFAYACRILFDCVLRIPYVIHHSADNLNYAGPLLFYTQQPPPQSGVMHIVPSGLLAENHLRTKKPTVSWNGNIPQLYFNKEDSKEPFDPFSAAFYMVTRYEEYLPFRADIYGRFPEFESLSGMHDFTHLPVVHAWADNLAVALKKQFPGFYTAPKKAEAIFTYDIDVAYAYRGRSWLTRILSLLKDLYTGQFSNAKAKLTTGFGKNSDPSDTYKLLENNPLQTLFFFLLAKKRTRYDRNISPDSPVLKQLIRQMTSCKTGIGIHPSYHSSENNNLITSEKKTLEEIANQSVTFSRQHFLRFRLPDTFRALEKAGILHDYSMQYPEMPGFRAGICVPFPFFDLTDNRETSLILHPGCIMETTFRDDLHLPASQSLDWYVSLWQQVQQAGGKFISIWHNDTLWEGLPDDHPLAFRQVHQKLVEIILKGSGTNS